MKSQVSVEFLVLMSILILISVALASVLLPLKIASTTKRLDEEARRLCEKVAFEVDAALNFGDGYVRSFFLPERVVGREYEVVVQNHSVWITIDEKAWSCTTVVNNIEGAVRPGWNRINNTGGKVYVS